MDVFHHSCSNDASQPSSMAKWAEPACRLMLQRLTRGGECYIKFCPQRIVTKSLHLPELSIVKLTITVIIYYPRGIRCDLSVLLELEFVINWFIKFPHSCFRCYMGRDLGDCSCSLTWFVSKAWCATVPARISMHSLDFSSCTRKASAILIISVWHHLVTVQFAQGHR